MLGVIVEDLGPGLENVIQGVGRVRQPEHRRTVGTVLRIRIRNYLQDPDPELFISDPTSSNFHWLK